MSLESGIQEDREAELAKSLAHLGFSIIGLGRQRSNSVDWVGKNAFNKAGRVSWEPPSQDRLLL